MSVVVNLDLPPPRPRAPISWWIYKSREVPGRIAVRPRTLLGWAGPRLIATDMACARALIPSGADVVVWGGGKDGSS